ncbi:MAG: hypothetical protein AB1558_01010, partial [Thermodesulfobacteriota bacterium]
MTEEMLEKRSVRQRKLLPFSSLVLTCLLLTSACAGILHADPREGGLREYGTGDSAVIQLAPQETPSPVTPSAPGSTAASPGPPKPLILPKAQDLQPPTQLPL